MVDAAVIDKAKWLDFQWWFLREKVSKAKKDLEVVAGRKISNEEWKEIREGLSWFKKQRRISPAKRSELSFEEWEEVRRAVRKLKPILQDRPLDEAVAIVSTKVRVNKHILNGMCADARVWKS